MSSLASVAAYPLMRMFEKSNSGIVAWSATGAGTAVSQVDLWVEVNNVVRKIPSGTPITMPTLAAGTDYAIWACPDGTLQASANFTTPPVANARRVGGFHYAPGGNAPILQKTAVTTGTALPAQTVPADTWALYSLEINAAGNITVTPAAANATTGYASEAAAIAALPARANNATTAWMGYLTVKTKSATAWVAGTDALAGGTSGNVASTTNYYAQLSTLSRGSSDIAVASTAFPYGLGGDTMPAINPYSMWDLDWRPVCPDPRGMTLVANIFWCDIYFLCMDYLIYGTSKYGVTIADGAAPPKRSIKFGGDGNSVYSDATWYSLGEALTHFGKRHISAVESALAFYGATESTSTGVDPNVTGLSSPYTSVYGVMQSTGNQLVFSSTFGGGAGVAVPLSITGGRGAVDQIENVFVVGGGWANGYSSGSRYARGAYTTTTTGNSFAARGVCAHYRRDA